MRREPPVFAEEEGPRAPEASRAGGEPYVGRRKRTESPGRLVCAEISSSGPMEAYFSPYKLIGGAVRSPGEK